MSVTDLSPPESKIGVLLAILLALLEEHERDGTIFNASKSPLKPPKRRDLNRNMLFFNGRPCVPLK